MRGCDVVATRGDEPPVIAPTVSGRLDTSTPAKRAELLYKVADRINQRFDEFLRIQIPLVVRKRAVEAGFDMHIPKPVDPLELTTVLARLTRRGAIDTVPSQPAHGRELRGAVPYTPSCVSL